MTIFKQLFFVCALMFAFSSCSKDDDAINRSVPVVPQLLKGAGVASGGGISA